MASFAPGSHIASHIHDTDYVGKDGEGDGDGDDDDDDNDEDEDEEER